MDLEATRASKRPELLSMADDYARHALSQRAAFEATHPAVMAAARAAGGASPCSAWPISAPPTA